MITNTMFLLQLGIKQGIFLHLGLNSRAAFHMRVLQGMAVMHDWVSYSKLNIRIKSRLKGNNLKILVAVFSASMVPSLTFLRFLLSCLLSGVFLLFLISSSSLKMWLIYQ